MVEIIGASAQTGISLLYIYMQEHQYMHGYNCA